MTKLSNYPKPLSRTSTVLFYIGAVIDGWKRKIKRLLPIILILAAVTLVSCEKEKLICTKTEIVVIDGIMMKYKISNVMSTMGSYATSDTTISAYGREIITTIEVDCGCD